MKRFFARAVSRHISQTENRFHVRMHIFSLDISVCFCAIIFIILWLDSSLHILRIFTILWLDTICNLRTHNYHIVTRYQFAFLSISNENSHYSLVTQIHTEHHLLVRLHIVSLDNSLSFMNICIYHIIARCQFAYWQQLYQLFALQSQRVGQAPPRCIRSQTGYFCERMWAELLHTIIITKP